MQTCGGGAPQHLKGQAWAFSTRGQSLRGRPWAHHPGEGPQLLHQPETLTQPLGPGQEGQGLRAGRYNSLNALSHLLWWTREAQCRGARGRRGRVRCGGHPGGDPGGQGLGGNRTQPSTLFQNS